MSSQTDTEGIPWDLVPLDSVVDIIMGQSPPSSTYNGDGRGLPFLQGKAEFGEVNPRPTVFCSDPIKIAPKDSVLISVRAPVGDANIATERSCIGRGLAAICARENLDHWFTFAWLLYSKASLEARGTGSTFKSINKSVLSSFSIPLPPLSEQKAIAEVLRTVQRAKEATQKVISATRQLKASLMKHLFNYGPVPFDQADKVPLKETEIGPMPEHWALLPSSDIFPKITDGTHDTPTKLDTGIPLATSKLIKKGRILLETCDYFISPDEHDQINERSRVDGLDIVYSMIGTIGEVAVVPNGSQPFSIKNVGLFKTNGDNLLAKFAAFWLDSSSARTFALGKASGSTQKYVPLGFLRSFPFPWPPIKERAEIVNALDVVTDKLAAEERRAEALDLMFNSLLWVLMTGRLRAGDHVCH